jgi:hypothetical protein
MCKCDTASNKNGVSRNHDLMLLLTFLQLISVWPCSPQLMHAHECKDACMYVSWHRTLVRHLSSALAPTAFRMFFTSSAVGLQIQRVSARTHTHTHILSSLSHNHPPHHRREHERVRPSGGNDSVIGRENLLRCKGAQMRALCKLALAHTSCCRRAHRACRPRHASSLLPF